MESAELTVCFSFDITCPYCETDMDLCDQNDDGIFTGPIFNNEWDDVVGMDATCPDCDEVFTISKVEC